MGFWPFVFLQRQRNADMATVCLPVHETQSQLDLWTLKEKQKQVPLKV